MDFIGKLTVYEPVIKEFESILNSWLSTPIIILGGRGIQGLNKEWVTLIPLELTPEKKKIKLEDVRWEMVSSEASFRLRISYLMK